MTRRDRARAARLAPSIAVIDSDYCPACRKNIRLFDRGWLLFYRPEQQAYESICYDCASTVLRWAATQGSIVEALESHDT